MESTQDEAETKENKEEDGKRATAINETFRP
jgi:hypothetical protein